MSRKHRRGRAAGSKQNDSSFRPKSNDGRATAKLGAFTDILMSLKISAQPLAEPPTAISSPEDRASQPPKPRLKAAAQERLAREFEIHMSTVAAADAVSQKPKLKWKARKQLSVVRTEDPVVGRSATAPKAPSMANLGEERRLAAARIRKAVEASSPELDIRPIEVSPETADAVGRAVRLGADLLGARAEPDYDNGFIVGFDLGTSSLKLAIRQPYQADDPIAAQVAPVELRSGLHPNLWQAVLWFDPTSEHFSLLPSPGALPLGGFKTGIIGGHGGARVLEEVPVTRAEACAAFVAMQLAHCLGWYSEARPLGNVGGDHFLGINIGIPVAAHDDKRTFENFARVVRAAFELAPFAGELSLTDVRSVCRRVTPALPAGVQFVPELVAAISGYAVEPTARAGAHLLVDVGASTLDIVAFNLIERARVSVFNAGVELLGAGALEVARNCGIPDVEFKRACDGQFDSVYGLAKSDRRAPSLFDPRFRRRPVQLIVTGGGCATELHRKFLSEMTKPEVLGDLPCVQPTPPSGITLCDCDRSRLLLAFGLTRDEPELLGLRLPSVIEDLKPLGRAAPEYPGKEVT